MGCRLSSIRVAQAKTPCLVHMHADCQKALAYNVFLAAPAALQMYIYMLRRNASCGVMTCSNHVQTICSTEYCMCGHAWRLDVVQPKMCYRKPRMQLDHWVLHREHLPCALRVLFRPTISPYVSHYALCMYMRIVCMPSAYRDRPVHFLLLNVAPSNDLAGACRALPC